jgi:Uncharacterized conserved protein (DUF2358)
VSSDTLVDDSSLDDATFCGPLSDSFRQYINGINEMQSTLDSWYSRSLKLKCPFMKRRATDLIDGIATISRFVLARHKSLPLPEVPGISCISLGGMKYRGLPIGAVASMIEKDWRGKVSEDGDIRGNGKGYYITGKLTKEIYRDDCFFDGPDPDMPVLGLRKYVASTSQLFDHKVSRADMIDISVDQTERVVTVSWRLEGILNLPWHPSLKPWTGRTSYYIDESGLIERHVESWDISVLDAFVSTLFPGLNYGAPPAAPLEVILEEQGIARNKTL